MNYLLITLLTFLTLMQACNNSNKSAIKGDKPWKISINTPKEQLPIDGIEHIEGLTVRYEGYGNPYSFTYHDTYSFTHYGKCTDAHN